jgi:hypothetical protein
MSPSDKPSGDKATGKPRVEAKDFAASTAVGSASRAGAAMFRRKNTGDGTASGTGAGVGAKAKAASGEGSGLLTVLVVAGVMIGMVALMIALG